MQKLSYLILLILVFGCTEEQKETPQKPNIVFVFADDMTYTAISALGNTEVKTPNIDRLVNHGTTFTHTYNMGAWNGAVCAASRAMIISGRSVWDVDNFRQGWKENKNFDKTWSKLMEGAGYDTYMTGKWHVACDAASIFQTAKHIRPGMPNQTKAGYHRPTSLDDKTWLPWDTAREGFWKGGKHWSEVVADDAESFLASAKDAENPFFMYIAFNAPHDPRQSPQEFVERFPVDKVSLPKPFYPRYPYALGLETIRDEELAPFPRTEFSVKTNRAEYYAIIAHLDVQIGRILDALAKNGLADNTYIVFTADHGLAVGHHGLMGKQNLHDHSLRVPYFICGPDVPAGKETAEKIYLQDAMATALDVAGAGRPNGVEFHSVLPIVRGEAKSPYASIYGAYLAAQRAIIAENHKLIVYPDLDEKLLFDLDKDEWEQNNLVDDKPELVETLTKQLEALQEEMDDDVSLSHVMGAE